MEGNLPAERDEEGRPEIRDTGIYSAFQRWEADGCIDVVFAHSVLRLEQDNLLDITVIYGDGTKTATKKGGDKVVALCDRRCNVIAPFVAAPGNHNESPLLREALPEVARIARMVGIDLQGTIVSLDGVYDCRSNRKGIFNARGGKRSKRGRKPLLESAIFDERFPTIQRVFAWKDKF